MPQAQNIDGVLITWGDRLFYPGNRVVKVKPQPKLKAGAASQRAAASLGRTPRRGAAGHREDLQRRQGGY